jgi:ubiquinone/menaquinone biosynthesis C-methylase UbiE
MPAPRDPDEIYALLQSQSDAAALGAALELGLFWRLAEPPRSPAELAAELGIPGRRCDYWLLVLEDMGLLVRAGGAYAPSPAARAAILETYGRDAWAYLAEETRQREPATRDLALRLRDPRSAWAAQGLTPPDYLACMRDDAVSAARFTRMLYEIHLPLAAELAGRLDLAGVGRMLDLAGGSGIMSLALLARHPQLEATVADFPFVCAAGRELASAHAAGARIRYHEADVMNDALPQGFDLVLECDIGLHRLDLYRKVLGCLRPGGRFVVLDQFAPEPGEAASERLRWALRAAMGDPEHAVTTAAQVRELLAAAGFAAPAESKLAGIWTLLEARKPT